VIGEYCACSSATGRIRPGRCWSFPGGGRAVPARIQERHLRLGHALASGCLEGGAGALDRLEALAAWACWVDLPAQADRQLRQGLDRRHPDAREQQPPPAHHRAGAGARRRSRSPTWRKRLWGKHLLEQAGRSCSETAWCDASVRTRSCRDHPQGGPCGLQAWWRRSTAAAWRIRTGRVVRGCAGLIDLRPPPARRCHDRPALGPPETILSGGPPT